MLIHIINILLFFAYPIFSDYLTLHSIPNLNLNNCQNPIQTSTTNITMGNCYNYVYYIQIGVGTPPQQFMLQFDTGSNVLWIPTTQVSVNGFKQSASTTFLNTNSPESLIYADNASVSGLIGYDYVGFGPLVHVNSSVLFVSKQINFKMDGNVTGIVGMGYTNSPNFLDLAYQAGAIQTNVFSLELSSTPNLSSLYYNTIPQIISQNTLYTQLYGHTEWSANLIGVFTNNTDLTSYAANIAVIDSGTSLFYLNTNLFNQFQTLYLQSCTNSTSGYYLCNCSRQPMPVIKFMFPGVQVQIEIPDYVVQLNQGMCQVYIGTLSTQANKVLLGDTLFRSNVITFNKNNASIGFYSRTNSTISITTLGNDESFLVSQYVMGGLAVLFFIISLFLLFFVDVKDFSNIKQPFLQPNETEKTMNAENIELKQFGNKH